VERVDDGSRTVEDRIEQVYRQQGTRLWRALAAFCGDPDVARDAVAESFAQALGRGDQIRDPAAWVWTAAFRIARGELGKRTARPLPELPYDLPEPATDLLTALSRLRPNQRGAILLHHYAGYPVKDAASILGLTTAATKMSLSRGRRRLRQLLEEDTDD
jgi:RNA polymerase sigma-70 factor (ECF subfamily)